MSEELERLDVNMLVNGAMEGIQPLYDKMEEQARKDADPLEQLQKKLITEMQELYNQANGNARRFKRLMEKKDKVKKWNIGSYKK